MLVVVSPAKKLNMSLVQGLKVSEPYFKKNVDELVNVVRDLSVKDLENLMDISPTLAELNRDRFKEFGNQQKKAAAFAFAGDTYKGLSIENLEKEDLDFAQKHLRILSGLYGLLRPLDEIEPYRLEMRSKLKGTHGSSLYDYWGSKISENLNQHDLSTKTEITNVKSDENLQELKPEAAIVNDVNDHQNNVKKGMLDKLKSFKFSSSSPSKFIIFHFSPTT